MEERQRWFMDLVEGLKKRNIAEQTGAANEQHYEASTRLPVVHDERKLLPSGIFRPSTLPCDE